MSYEEMRSHISACTCVCEVSVHLDWNLDDMVGGSLPVEPIDALTGPLYCPSSIYRSVEVYILLTSYTLCHYYLVKG